VTDHYPVPIFEGNLLAHGRRGTRELGVQRMLVLQATHQPTAGTRDLQRVRREILAFGHPQTDGLEVLQERGATQVAPTVAEAPNQPGGVA
jgi:hypothetical protein